MPITTKEVERIADLAHLNFEVQELELFVTQFQKILEHFAQLESLPTDQAEPTYHALEQEKELATPMREDEVRPSLPVEAALANAPDPAEGHFRVPAIIE